MKSKSDVTRKSNSSTSGQSNSGHSSSGQSTGQPGNAAGNGYAPSVPITVYRELAAELQATKAMMESMNAQHQQLVHQNQRLKQEIERLVHSALTLQQIAGVSQPTTAMASTPVATPSNLTVSNATSTPATASNPEAIASWVRQSNRSAQPQGDRAADPTPIASDSSAQSSSLDLDPVSDDLFTEIAQEPHRPAKRPAPKDMGGFWLTTTIAVIVVTAFGAGFLVVRPLLPGR